MENTLNKVATTKETLSTPLAIETSMSGPKNMGLLIFFLVFGVFGLWAALAPLDSAAFGLGSVTVKSYKKIVQHLEGGIILGVNVRNGDSVRAGEPLLTLDNTQSLAQLAIVNSQFIALKTKEARLIAERDELNTVAYPESLAITDTLVTEEIDAQNEIFLARKASNEGSIEVLEQRIGQLENRNIGLQALKDTKTLLASSFAEELEDTRALLSQGFADKIRLRELERSYATFTGEAAELSSNIASTEIQVGETRLQILQQDKEFRNEVVTELSDTQSQLKDIRERITALEDIVARTIVRAPEAGLVNGMQYHSTGSVIRPGDPIAEIVPQSDELVIEASMSPNDIDRIKEGQEATIRFSSFGSSVPTTYGRVLNLSADSMMDQNTGASFYLARLEVTQEGLENLGDLVLLPGMPAEVFINTGSRTLLQYLFKPFTNAVARSLNED
jgi:epimerase transport system membrane fusion protein